MKQFYLIASRFLDSNLLSILIGVFSGIAVELGTGGKIDSISGWAISLFIVATLALIVLVRIRQTIDDAYVARDSEGYTPTDQWRYAADTKNTKRIAFFLVSLFVFLSCAIVGIIFIARINAQNKAEELEEKSLQQRLIQTQEKMKKDSIFFNQELNRIKDSIAQLARQKSILVEKKNTAEVRKKQKKGY